jgi:hypothetical protein
VSVKLAKISDFVAQPFSKCFAPRRASLRRAFRAERARDLDVGPFVKDAQLGGPAQTRGGLRSNELKRVT